MFPDIAVYAKGANADLMKMADVAGDAMRIMSIPASDYKKVLELEPNFAMAEERLKDFVVTRVPAKSQT